MGQCCQVVKNGLQVKNL